MKKSKVILAYSNNGVWVYGKYGGLFYADKNVIDFKSLYNSGYKTKKHLQNALTRLEMLGNLNKGYEIIEIEE